MKLRDAVALVLSGSSTLLGAACHSAPSRDDRNSAPNSASPGTLGGVDTAAAKAVPTPPSAVSSAIPAASSDPIPVALLSSSSPQPSLEEWASAPLAANAAEERFHPKDCALKQVREWVSVQCGARYYEANWQGPQARRGEDYFTTANPQGAGIIFRSRRGNIERILMTKPGVEDALQVAWPTSAPAATAYFEENPNGFTDLLLPREPQPIPDVPPKSSSRPAEADWLAAPEVNTAPRGRTPKGCTVRMLRDWVKLHCIKGQNPKHPPDILSPQGFGTPNVDFFWVSWSPASSWLEFRLRKGTTQHAQLDLDVGSFHVEWPESSPKPTIISVEAK